MKKIQYILDTDHTIDMINDKNGMQSRLEELGVENIAISEVTLAELCVRYYKTGIEKYNLQIAFIENNFQIIPFTAHREYGEIRAILEQKGQRLDDMDCMIAATALQSNHILITANEKHFKRVPLLSSLNLRK